MTETLDSSPQPTESIAAMLTVARTRFIRTARGVARLQALPRFHGAGGRVG